MGHPETGRGGHGDFYGFVDDDEARTGYLVYTTHGHMAVDRLEPGYLTSTRNTTAIPEQFWHINGTEGYQESPLMFKRAGVYYVLTGGGCCVCHGGSDALVWTSSSPLGPYEYRGNVGAYSNGTSRLSAQMGFVATIPQPNGEEVVLFGGDRWRHAPDGLHGHDPQVWLPLSFRGDGSIDDLQWRDSFTLNVPQRAAGPRWLKTVHRDHASTVSERGGYRGRR
jgi:hypothetical protein